MTPAGFPHSEIPGSKPVCGSPGLIAACHVLLRRSSPRHPPFTLSSLAIKFLIREFFATRFCCQRAAPGAPGRVDHQTLTRLLELIGLEPTTYGLQSRRSPN